jgi:F420-non-reducing hydrogenase iron-sulfur subunit
MKPNAGAADHLPLCKKNIDPKTIERYRRGETNMAEWEPKIVAFLCNWCSYGAADLAGVSRMEYPPNIRVIRIPCTGRMSPKFALAALREGADAVWVSG